MGVLIEKKKASLRHRGEFARLDLRPCDGVRGLPCAFGQGTPMQGAQFAKLMGQALKYYRIPPSTGKSENWPIEW
jgi:hypothetical protein